MAKTTVYSFVRHCLNDREFNYAGGIPTNERRFLDAIGFDYTADENGDIQGEGEDLMDFYQAMATIRRLHYKYKKGE